MREEKNILIVGAGPAGLSAAIYAGRAAMKVILLEKNYPGGQVATTSDIANYPGFPAGVDGFDLADQMRKQAEAFGVTFTAAEVKDISIEEDKRFLVKTATKNYLATAVIVATGSEPLMLNIPGEDRLRGRGVSYCGTCDGPFFKGKKLVVVGGGDSAMKEALHLTHFASRIVMVVREPTFTGGEAIYKGQIAENAKIEVRYNTQVMELLGEAKVEGVKLKNSETGEESVLETDGMFVFIGSRPNTRLICTLLQKQCGMQIETDHDMATEIPGLFAAGDVRKNSWRQIATAVGEGATAAMAAQRYLADLEARGK